jgi:NAD(P)-dependent dehydrogenase (short-subunit alcohol dehydrogenase family)
MANVAGIMGAGGPIPSIEEGVLDRVLAVNLKGVFFGVQAALRVMGEQRAGSIINMASAAIDAPAPNLAVYSMAKAGVAMLTRVAAVEGGPMGVRVNCVAPGFVVTPMTQRGTEEQMAAVEAGMRKRSALGAVGDPADIANAVLYLASDASGYMTGQTLRPNGGTIMPA